VPHPVRWCCHGSAGWAGPSAAGVLAPPGPSRDVMDATHWLPMAPRALMAAATGPSSVVAGTPPCWARAGRVGQQRFGALSHAAPELIRGQELSKASEGCCSRGRAAVGAGDRPGEAVCRAVCISYGELLFVQSVVQVVAQHCLTVCCSLRGMHGISLLLSRLLSNSGPISPYLVAAVLESVHAVPPTASCSWKCLLVVPPAKQADHGLSFPIQLMGCAAAAAAAVVVQARSLACTLASCSP